VQTSTPKVALGWIIPLYGAVFGYVLWTAWSRDITYGLIASAMTAVVLLFLLPHVSTSFGEGGISQLTWRGRQLLRWHDVREAVIETDGFPVVLLRGDTGTSIKVNSVFYSDFGSTLQWLRRRLSLVSVPLVAVSPPNKR